MNEETLAAPSVGDKIRCDCHNKGCHATVTIMQVGAMVAIGFGPVTVHDGSFSVLLDQTHALEIALVLQEAAHDAANRE